jgi:hypothetical protein
MTSSTQSRHLQLSALLPENPGEFRGHPGARWLLILFLTMITARSLIHIFLPDGGASTIATIDIKVAGGQNIVGLFGQWGAIQLLLVGVLWTLLFSYPGFVPFIIATLLCEPFLRGLSGYLKPIETLGVAPGAALNWVSVPILLATLYLALWTPQNMKIADDASQPKE